ncbi:hypothetical protein HHI36_023301 [Cryptolaemus montrouzieri]|uniref:Uncharacterized protein n=1 Tax=Cryptolaemus montrouzieri TaxID=559131 RepID=A0ABD2PGQ3_9CUCU
MDDDELTKLAVAQLIAEGEKFVKRRELTYTFDEPTRTRPNLRYFKNTLGNCLSSNNRIEKARKFEAQKRLWLLRRDQNRKEISKQIEKPINKTIRKSEILKKETSDECQSSFYHSRQSPERSSDSGFHSPRRKFSDSEKNCSKTESSSSTRK